LLLLPLFLKIKDCFVLFFNFDEDGEVDRIIAEMKTPSDVKLLGSSYGLTPAGSRKVRPIADIRLVCEARGIPITSADGKYIDRAVLEKAIVEKLGLKKEKSESPGASAKMNLHRLNQLLW
jgi:hypothetical protein